MTQQKTGQSARQIARQAMLDAQAAARARETARMRVRADLGARVAQAIAERDATVRVCEQRAAAALEELVRETGSVKAALEWCGQDLTPKEATRIRRLAREADAPSGSRDAAAAPEVPAPGPTANTKAVADPSA